LCVNCGSTTEHEIDDDDDADDDEKDNGTLRFARTNVDQSMVSGPLNSLCAWLAG
jgi:hypothetical protein